jgi:hypothetical protein
MLSPLYPRLKHRRPKEILVLVSLALLSCGLQSQAQTSPTNTNIAGPQATATGAVTNQAVQVLQGPYAVNTYGGGTSCQSATFNIQGFAYGSGTNSEDPEVFDTGVFNPGFTVGVSIPIDRSLQNLCKERAAVEIQRAQAESDKARLDYELVRLLRCGEAKKQGILFRPDSPYSKVCSDVMVVQPGSRPASAN